MIVVVVVPENVDLTEGVSLEDGVLEVVIE